MNISSQLQTLTICLEIGSSSEEQYLSSFIKPGDDKLVYDFIEFPIISDNYCLILILFMLDFIIIFIIIRCFDCQPLFLKGSLSSVAASSSSCFYWDFFLEKFLFTSPFSFLIGGSEGARFVFLVIQGFGYQFVLSFHYKEEL